MSKLLTSRWLWAAMRGGVAGISATARMTTAMKIAQRFGLLGELPPQRISDHLLDAAGAKPEHERTSKLAGYVSHFGFGVALGSVYGVLREARLLPRSPLTGIAFGTAVWAASYWGWVPALSILPKPSHDRPGRPITMLVSHWIYGASLERRLG